MHTIVTIDGQILLWIQEHLRCSALTPFFRFITHLGDAGIIWIVLTTILVLIPKTRKVGWMSALSLVFTLIVDNLLLKNIVARIRPYDRIPEIQILIERQRDFSFPSGHTGSSFAAAVVMARNLPKRYGVPALVLAILIAFSRLYVGVHFPTDVAGGAVIGILLALVAEKLCKIIWEKKQ
ncbi:MAG: phosphatase PAP2 family protein [Lachnospiraceae bacterium]